MARLRLGRGSMDLTSDKDEGKSKLPSLPEPPPLSPTTSSTTNKSSGGKSRWSPILPFFGVMLRGHDAPFSTPRDQAPAYHPSVGYARDVFVAITMNWVVDVVGFTYLFHSYLVTLRPWYLPWMLALGLGLTFSTAFATFAMSLIRKPIRSPSFDVRSAVIAILLALVSLSGFVSVAVFADSIGGASGVVQGLSLAALLAGAGVWLFNTFGFSDGFLIFTRAFVMFTVGYLVAGPLHETMFHKEIMAEYKAQALAEITAEMKDKEPVREAAWASEFETCMRRKSLPPDLKCEQPRVDREKAELLVQAIDYVKEEELLGVNSKSSKSTRDYLLTAAKDLDATQVVVLIGPGGTGQAGMGPRYQRAVRLEPKANRDLDRTRDTERSCLENASLCEEEAQKAPEVVNLDKREEELREKAERIREGEEEPGAIERALALEAIINGEGQSEDAEERSALLNSRLVAAWFLAMVMPLIVLVMKVTAGDKLEPYLRKRWTGR
ncbi:MAG: hypothetical protein AAGA48_33515 [Myxococcota bacterium]